MATLNISFYFPYSWYQWRSVKIRNRYNDLLGIIKFGKETNLAVSNTEVKRLKFSTDFFACNLDLEQIEEEYALVYFDINNHLDLLKSNILQVKTFETARQRSRFRKSLYPKFVKTRLLQEDKNYGIIFFGLIISFIILGSGIMFVDDEIEHVKDLKMNFIIGLTSFISLGVLLQEADTTVVGYQEKISTIIIFFLISLFYIENLAFLLFMTSLIFVFTVESLVEFKK